MCLFIIMSISVWLHKLWCPVRDMRLGKCSIIIIIYKHPTCTIDELIGYPENFYRNKQCDIYIYM